MSVLFPEPDPNDYNRSYDTALGCYGDPPYATFSHGLAPLPWRVRIRDCDCLLVRLNQDGEIIRRLKSSTGGYILEGAKRMQAMILARSHNLDVDLCQISVEKALDLDFIDDITTQTKVEHLPPFINRALLDMEPEDIEGTRLEIDRAIAQLQSGSLRLATWMSSTVRASRLLEESGEEFVVRWHSRHDLLSSPPPFRGIANRPLSRGDKPRAAHLPEPRSPPLEANIEISPAVSSTLSQTYDLEAFRPNSALRAPSPSASTLSRHPFAPSVELQGSSSRAPIEVYDTDVTTWGSILDQKGKRTGGPPSHREDSEAKRRRR